MQDYYVSRIISSPYLRPGLLLGSAGLVLGATLVLFLAADNGATARVAWPTPAATGAGASDIELNRSASVAPAIEQVTGHVAASQRLALLREPYAAEKQISLVPAPAANRPGATLAPTHTTNTGRSVRLVQHSWDTIKAMFR